jgi:hypothetical protein
MRIAVLGAAAFTVAILCLKPVIANETCPANLYQPASCQENARAGWPWCFSIWARPQDPCEYTGYYIGGGAPGPRSRGRCPAEGTWGWDYEGRKFSRLVRLGWTHPPRRQGGEGSYQPDGPRISEAVHEILHGHHEAK